MSTLHTIDATETINRIIDFFPLHQQKQVRIMLAGTLKAIISQRLLPRADGQGRVPGRRGHGLHQPHPRLHPRPRAGAPRADAIKEGEFYGMQTFDQALLKLYEEGLITLSDAAAVAANPHDFKLLVQRRATTSA